MPHSTLTIDAPRWTLRAVVLSTTITLGIYLLLPYLETLSPTPGRDTTVRSVQTTQLAPPAPPPPERIFEPEPAWPDTPQPKLEMPRQQLNPVAASMNLEMALGDLSGDFSVNFGVRQTDLAQQVRDMIFDIGDLDEPPRPLARLDPVYPPRARMRRIEGEVTVEFVVDPDGTVRNIEVIASRPGDTFTDAAVRAIRRWRFAPGTKDGRTVPTRVRQKVSFSLQ
jgi:protein TonB